MIQSKSFPQNQFYLDRYQTGTNFQAEPSYLEYSADGFEQADAYGSFQANYREEWSGLPSGSGGKTTRPSDDDLLNSIDGGGDETNTERNFLNEEIKLIQQKIRDHKDLKNFSDLLTPLQSAAEKIRQDLAKEGSLGSVEQRLESLRENFEAAVETAQDRISNEKDTHDAKLETLENRIEKIKNVAGVSETLEAKAAELKTKLNAADADLAEIDKGVKQLEDDAKAATEKSELRENFSNLSAIVPNDGYGKDRTKDLAAALDIAMKNNSWTPVTALLTDLRDNHAQEADNAIRQLVGALYYRPANTKEEELKKLLGCIDKQVLGLMADIAGNCGEASANDYAETATKRAKYSYYGTGAETAALLRQVIAKMP